MKYCSNCGKQIDDNAKFCIHCGSSQAEPASVANTQTVSGNMKRIHCPECKSTQISPIVETNISGGTGFQVGVTRRTAVSSVSLTSANRNYWMCQICGRKFRNIDNLKEELAAQEKNLKVLFNFMIVTLAISLLFVVCGAAILFGLMFSCALVFIGCYFLQRKTIEKTNQELQYLQANCFN